MRATEFEFRHRFWFILLFYFVGFGLYRFDHLNAVEALTHWFFHRSDPHLDSLAARHAMQGLFVLSAALVTAAAWIRTWAGAYLRTDVVHDGELHTEKLVADGPYRHLRNPLYLGGLLIAAGLAMLASRMGAVVIIVGESLIMMRLIGREEAALGHVQGEAYRAFARAVPRLWPSLRPCLPSGGLQPRWSPAFLSEAWLWAIAGNGFIFAWKLDGRLYQIILWVSGAAYFGLRMVLERVSRRNLPPPGTTGPGEGCYNGACEGGHSLSMTDENGKTRGLMEAGEPAAEDSQLRLKASPRAFTFGQRVQLVLATWLGYLAVLLIGRSLRWEVFGKQNYEEAVRRGKSFIVTFWHREIFPAVWYWRQRGMVVMVSQNFDGEFISRVIHAHGYATARGSSSRGASRVLVEMVRTLRQGMEAAVTPDGPRGPRFVAKPGVVQLARLSGSCILCFHIVPRRSWVFRKSWDQTEFPKPFTRTAIFIAPPIEVPRHADEKQQAKYLQVVQSTMDQLMERGKAWIEKQD